MKDSYWAKPIMVRHESWLLGQTLEERIAPDAEIRQFDALLRRVDWSGWEASYRRDRGQPPIHPRLVAGTILFCTLRGWHSSRRMEKAAGDWLELVWFLEGRKIDHSTFCYFRKTFRSQLEELFTQMARLAARPALREGINGVGVDGTRIRANSDRHGARTAASLVRRLEQVAEQRKAVLDRMDRLDASEALEEALDTTGIENVETLVEGLKALDAQRVKLETALAVARARDKIKQDSDGPNVTATRVPVSDPDAHLLPNKEGGYAPNYTPMLAVDLASGAILDARVPDGAEEAATLPEIVAASALRLERPIEAALADGNFASGPNLKHFEQPGQPTLYAPACEPVPDVVKRENPREPVAVEHWGDLPMSGKGDKARLTREAFVYEAGEDVYYCPQGRALRRKGQEQCKWKSGETYLRWRYQSESCAGCPLASRCLSGKATTRSVIRDEYQSSRERHCARMNDPTARAIYARRAPVVEGTFGYIKQAMGFRRFLTRGRGNVTGEWLWVCVAFNAGKILRRLPAAGRTTPQHKPKSALRGVANGQTVSKDRLKAAAGAVLAIWMAFALLARSTPCRAVFRVA